MRFSAAHGVGFGLPRERSRSEIRAYLLERSPQGADNVRADIDRTIETLAEFALRTTADDELVVVHVRDGRRAAPRAGELE